MKVPSFIKKVNEVTWDIPTSFLQGMRVPGRIFATEKIVAEMDEAVFQQIANVATLPGIQKYSYCMPDGHSGYGFPIGGVAAFDRNENGVISPGGVGFDINCLPPSAKIAVGNGTWIRIGDLEDRWRDHQVIFFDRSDRSLNNAPLILFLKKMEPEKLFEILTECGRKIQLTADHPLLTAEGMKKAHELNTDDTAYIRPFLGVEYEQPSDNLIVSKQDVNQVLDELQTPLRGSGRKQIIEGLRRRNLHNLRYSSPALPILLRLLGFIFGDGCISVWKKSRKGAVSFYGKKEDLESIRSDLKLLGFSAQQIFQRKRNHRIKTFYGVSEFSFQEYSLNKKSTGFAALLIALGAPWGKKVAQPYRVPSWIMKAPRWQKRLFLAAFFGAELSSPKTVTKHNFYAPQLNMNKLFTMQDNAIAFLEDIRDLLQEFDITSSEPVLVPGYEYPGVNGKTIGFRISIHSYPQNLINLYETIGFEYNRKKQNLASLAASYLRLKEMVKLSRKKIRVRALAMYHRGNTPVEIRAALASDDVSPHFINHSIWPDRSLHTRILPQFLSFKDYSSRLVGDGIVAERITAIREIPYSGFVYDVTVGDTNHNFIADHYITHNCGMRLVLTNLTLQDIQPHQKELLNNLFERIPSGVGSQGFVKLTSQQFRKVIDEGASWCVREGYGWQEDLERQELFGKAEGADNKTVTDRAVSRGLNQIGTLGSGNHYLEVQHVKEENILDKQLAKRFGIFPDQIVIMFHCGSRGFGHQVATDYLQIFLKVMESKYGIKILDRELACAPFNSPEGQQYFSAMKCGVNMSFANRQTILHRIREVFSKVFNQDAEKLGMHCVFDISHNRASLEKHKVDNEWKELIVHRKGATAAYGPGREEIPPLYRDIGVPIIIGGSMETGSYLLVGTEESSQTWCSTCHGAGRTMSRTQARKLWRGDQLQKDMEQRGIHVKTASYPGLAEEAGAAYKDVHEVINAVSKAKLSKPVASFVPILNIKG